MPTGPTNDVVRDTVHVAVGFAVLGVQRLQVARRDLEAALPAPAATALRASIDTATNVASAAARHVVRSLRR
jgi:hypothetical protein